MQQHADTNLIRREFRAAVRELTDRGLLNSAKFIGEQMIALPPQLVPEKLTTFLDTDQSSSMIQQQQQQQAMLDESTLLTIDTYLFAKSCFDMKEYLRCADIILPITKIDKKGLTCKYFRRALFLRLYALYLAGEKRKEEETIELSGMDKLSFKVQNFSYYFFCYFFCFFCFFFKKALSTMPLARKLKISKFALFSTNLLHTPILKSFARMASCGTFTHLH